MDNTINLLNNYEIITNKIFIDENNLSYNKNTKKSFITYNIYNSLNQEIKYHNFCILFNHTLPTEEKEIIKNYIIWQKQIIQKSINNNTLDIDFPNWDKKTIIVDIYIVEQNKYLKGFSIGLKNKNEEKKYLSKKVL